MKTIGVAIFFLALMFVVTGCSSSESMVKDDSVMMEKEDTVMVKTESDSMVKDDSVMMEKNDSELMMQKEDAIIMEKESDSIVKGDSVMMTKYSGNVIAGTTTQYIEFNQADYDAALKEEKVILLNFYASWCPSCQEENIQAIKGFEGLDLNNVVGFRVNYKDSDTNSVETEMAKKFGISYQHTKVILINGEQVLKNTESWNGDKYISELSKYSMN